LAKHSNISAAASVAHRRPRKPDDRHLLNAALANVHLDFAEQRIDAVENKGARARGKSGWMRQGAPWPNELSTA